MAEMDAHASGPFEPEVDNPTVGKRTQVNPRGEEFVLRRNEHIRFPHAAKAHAGFLIRKSGISCGIRKGRDTMKKVFALLTVLVLLLAEC